MGYSIGGPDQHGRWIGYGVPAYCDHPKCNEKIDRGISYVCGGEPYGGEKGCGQYFCGLHLNCDQLCTRCHRRRPAYKPKGEHPEWMEHVLTDESWAGWRAENPEKVDAFRSQLSVQRTGDVTPDA
jgi:hypothetical protein